MSPKIGRPKIKNPKANDVKVRLDDDTHKKLLDYCTKHKTSKAETIRKGIDLVLQDKK